MENDEVKPSAVEELFLQAKTTCINMGVQDSIITTVNDSENDWVFIMLVDSLIETVMRKFISAHVHIESNSEKGRLLFDKSISKIQWSGALGAEKLLNAIGHDDDIIKNIDCIRKIRNQFAHDIGYIDKKLSNVILENSEKRFFLKTLFKGVDLDLNLNVAERCIAHESKLTRILIATRMLEVLASMHSVPEQKGK